MKKKIFGVLFVVAIVVIIAINVNVAYSKNDFVSEMFLANTEALAQIEWPDWPDDFYCRCHNESNGYCLGGNAISLRPNCYKGDETIDCHTWNSNCE